MLFVVVSDRFLMLLIILEMFGFILLYSVSARYVTFIGTNFVLLLTFSIMVMEGIIGLAIIIILISHSGTDYVGLASVC